MKTTPEQRADFLSQTAGHPWGSRIRNLIEDIDELTAKLAAAERENDCGSPRSIDDPCLKEGVRCLRCEVTRQWRMVQKANAENAELRQQLAAKCEEANRLSRLRKVTAEWANNTQEPVESPDAP